METIDRNLRETMRSLGFVVHGQCPASEDLIEHCNRCYDEDDKTQLTVGTRPHIQNVPTAIKLIPKMIFDELERIGITWKSSSDKDHHAKVNKYAKEARH